MAFVIVESVITSFAEYQDVLDTDQRIFNENEGLNDSVIDALLVRSTGRILNQLKSSAWYRKLAFNNGASAVLIPDIDPSKIRTRKSEFTDLCVYHALTNYILPKVADFGSDTNSELAKISFYLEKYNSLFDELTNEGDWYDYDGDATVETKEKLSMPINYQRVR